MSSDFERVLEKKLTSELPNNVYVSRTSVENTIIDHTSKVSTIVIRYDDFDVVITGWFSTSFQRTADIHYPE